MLNISKFIPIPDAEEIRAADTATLIQKGIESHELMERAAYEVYKRIFNRTRHFKHIEIWCGMGNNGGDGLALARMLAASGCSADIFIAQTRDKGSNDFEYNLNRLIELGLPFKQIAKPEELPPYRQSVLYIDALFGTGINSAVNGITEDIIDYLNNRSTFLISIDLPSGMPAAYEPAFTPGKIVKADETISFQTPRISQLFPEYGNYCGKLFLADIGLVEPVCDGLSKSSYYVTIESVRPFMPSLKKFAHKAMAGKGLLIAGSKGMKGAALLGMAAAQRCGAGLLTLHSVKSIETALNVSLPACMFSMDENDEYVTSLPSVVDYSAVAIGPGMGTEAETAQVLKKLIQEKPTNLVLDADALNILSENKTWLSFLPDYAILTPHRGEFERLVGKCSSSMEVWEKQREFSFRYNCIVVLKGAHTCITTPDGKSFFNSSGNAGMAKGGSGDTLTGIILALLCRGLSPVEAAIKGVFLHGLAADLAVIQNGEVSLNATDVIHYLPDAIIKLMD